MKNNSFSKIMLIVLFSLLLMVPVSAQTAAEGDELDTIEITFSGYISFDADGNVYIDGYFLAPAGAISPSALSEGQYVEVTGVFLNDDTFKLTEIDTSVEEPFESTDEGDETGDDVTCDATGATEDTADDCATDDTGDETGDDATDETGDETGDDATCTPDGHPVAARIADAFDVDACEVEAMHDDGNGFGNIARAYLLAEAANLALVDGDGELIDAQYFIDMADSGMGWGQIVKDSGVSPSDLAPGKLKKRAESDDDTASDETYSSTESSNNGNGNSNSNNGNGNSNANANSNNGNGNSNANANSNNGNSNSNKDKDKDKSNNGKKK